MHGLSPVMRAGLPIAALPGLFIAAASLVVTPPAVAWALEHGRQQLRHMGLDGPRFVKSSWTRNRTRVPCIGR